MLAKLLKLREKVWLEDIPSPTVPEYKEHHESIQRIIKAVEELMAEVAIMQEEIIDTVRAGDELYLGDLDIYLEGPCCLIQRKEDPAIAAVKRLQDELMVTVRSNKTEGGS